MHKAQMLTFLAAVLLITSAAHAQECRPAGDDSPERRARRAAAGEYIAAVNAAQTRVQQHEGRYALLHELSGVPSAPVGFIPKLLVDQWSYMISLKDYFDRCGLALFSDERGLIYEAHPSSTLGERNGRAAVARDSM
jgi:hypothetical protein